MTRIILRAIGLTVILSALVLSLNLIVGAQHTHRANPPGGPAQSDKSKTPVKPRIRKEIFMGDTTVMKVQSKHSPTGEMGQKYLASGKNISMRLWENTEPGEAKPESARDYETVGYVIAGRAELHSEGQMVLLEPGDSWIVPRSASHT
jgi:quercetin dioxygenase-like cupin family protein